jgi:hypothetical protein
MVLDVLDRQPTAWVRVSAVRRPVGEPWKLKLLEIVTGAPLIGWQARSWVYPEALFESYVATGSEIAEALRAGAVRVCGEKVPTVVDFHLQDPDRGSTLQLRASQDCTAGWAQAAEVSAWLRIWVIRGRLPKAKLSSRSERDSSATKRSRSPVLASDRLEGFVHQTLQPSGLPSPPRALTSILTSDP